MVIHILSTIAVSCKGMIEVEGRQEGDAMMHVVILRLHN